MKLRLAVLAPVCLAALSAKAQDEACGSERPFVSVRVPAELGGRPFHAQVVAQLRASLTPKGMDVCAASAPRSANTEPIAAVVLTRRQTARVTITVEAHDEVTHKRVARDIDLTSLPADAWALALAVGADEILRASWAELAIRTQAPRARPAPAPVRDIVKESLVAHGRGNAATLTLGAAGVVDLFSGGHTQTGVDLRIGADVLAPVAVLLTAGLRAGLPADSASGRVRSNSVVVGAGAGVLLTSATEPLGVEVGLRAQAIRLEFHGEATDVGDSSSGSATAITALAAVGAFYAPDPALRVFVEAGALLPLREAAARDGDTTATAVAGLGGSFSLGLAGVL